MPERDAPPADEVPEPREKHRPAQTPQAAARARARQQREAAALRENLRRRKAQDRARAPE
jgi:hypothetical protein